VGGGAAWNDFERFHSTQTIVTGGVGFRYELARKYGIHMGLDPAFGPDTTAVYVQVGSAWARPLEAAEKAHLPGSHPLDG
jgi:hypothetical protein